MTGRRRNRRQAGRGLVIATVAVLAVVAAAWTGYAQVTRGPGKHPVAARTSRPAAASPAAAPRPCTVSAILVPSCGAWWGMFVPADSGGGGLVSAVQAEETQLGRPLDIIQRYHDMSQTPDGIFPNPAEEQIGQHHLLLFSWNPTIWSSHTFYRWQEIADGALDSSIIIPEAQRLKAYGRPVFLSFSPEADTGAAIPGEGTIAQYVAAWRHVHDVFTQAGARNVIWVWTTEGYHGHWPAILQMYPGNAYVDWIGWDPYNFYTCHRNGWLTFAQTVLPYYRWLLAHHFGDKPFMLPEFGSQASPSDPAQEAAWYTSILATIRAMPNLKALVNWNSTVPGCQLALSSAPAAALSAYRQTGLSPYLNQKLP